LLEPGYIGTVKIKRRIIKTGSHHGFYPYEDGNIPPKTIDYYEALAAGGAGLVTVGVCAVDWPLGCVPGIGYRMDDEKYIPSLEKLADAIHKYDCPAFVQLLHLGPMHPERMTGYQPISSSSIPKIEIPRPNFSVAREMTIQEIKRVEDKFVAAAVNAQKAGFDGVELNAACNHLLNSFLSRAWNRRHDAYGCDNLENRARIVIEIIDGIRLACGKFFAIITLINGLESGLKDGIALEESKVFAKMFERAGSDAIHVRVEFYTNPQDILKRDSTHFPDMLHFPEDPKGLEKEIDMSRHGKGGWVPVAAEIKKVVSIPVVVIGRMDPDLGEKILAEGKADFVAYNRRLMADHELPNKLAEGREEEIAPCTACMTCFDAVEHLTLPRCRINPSLGNEKEYEIKPTTQEKRVMIVGGGPAGMEAARVAALRGHDVSLYDKLRRLGGSMLVAATVKGLEKENLMDVIHYYEVQLRKLGVKVYLDKEVTVEMVDKVMPDVVILAAGALHKIPKIPGIGGSNVLTGERLHNRLKSALKYAGPKCLHWLTNLYMPVGKRVVVIGGRLHGCQTAEFLVNRGREVTIVDTCPDKQIGEGLLETFIKPWLLLWLDEEGVRIITEVKYEEVNKEGLVIITKEGKRETIKADTIVTAMPMEPNIRIQEEMRNRAKEVIAIGDSRNPQYIVDAIADGARVGRQI
jgi:2,4-dienoyl-CoA reductase (NADPH2)